VLISSKREAHCHPGRSEGSGAGCTGLLFSAREVLRFAQDDR